MLSGLPGASRSTVATVYRLPGIGVSGYPGRSLAGLDFQGNYASRRFRHDGTALAVSSPSAVATAVLGLPSPASFIPENSATTEASAASEGEATRVVAGVG